MSLSYIHLYSDECCYYSLDFIITHLNISDRKYRFEYLILRLSGRQQCPSGAGQNVWFDLNYDQKNSEPIVF